MNPWTIAGVVFLLASYVLSQKIGVDAGAKLDDSTKLKLAEIFPKRNLNYTITIFSIVVVFFISLYLFPQYSQVLTVCYAIAFVVYILLKLFLNVIKLKEIGVPSAYVRSVIMSFVVFIGGGVAAGILISFGSSR